uniref:RNA-directed DNA polymerase n=1 Tax=Fagus sylvatica TaxID=28930 RepID=A0A2N9GAJ7_FAGSY
MHGILERGLRYLAILSSFASYSPLTCPPIAMKSVRAWALMACPWTILRYRTRSTSWPIESIIQRHQVYSSPYGVGGSQLHTIFLPMRAELTTIGETTKYGEKVHLVWKGLAMVERSGRMAFKHHFSLLPWRGARGAEGRHFQGRITFPKFNHYTKSWSSSLTIRHGKYPEEDDPPQHQPKPRKVEESWSSTPPSGPRRVVQRSTANSVTKKRSAAAPAAANDEEGDEEDEARLKRPRNLPWPPKSVPSEVGNDERPAGYFLCPLVTVDLGHKKSLDWNFSIRADFKSSRNTKPTAVHGTLPVVNGSLPTPKSLKFHDYCVSLICSSFLASHRRSQVHYAQSLDPRHWPQPRHGRDTRPGWWTDARGRKFPSVVDKLMVAEQVLGGGEIPVGGPQQMALMFEMIKGMQQNQVELAESLRQLREANGQQRRTTKTRMTTATMKRGSLTTRNDTPFVTMSDVADLLKQERERPPKEPRHFVRRPPYPIELLKEPYPEKYDTPVFALFDGRKGKCHGTHQQVSGFHGTLCCTCTKQQIGEDLVKYIHRFRDVSLDCHVKYQEGELVEVCIDNMLPEFRAHLENLDITRFAPLLQKARKTAISVKPQVEKSRDKKSLPQTLTVSTATAPSGTKRKNPTDKAYEEPPPLPFTAEEMMAIFDKWVQDQVIKLPKISKQPTPEEQKDPKWEVNRKIQNGTLLLSEEQQKVHQTPFPNYNKGKGKAVVSVVIHGNVSDMEAEESAAASSSLVPAAVRTLQKSPKFKSLFNQLGFGPEARNAATEALITIAAESGATCFTAEAHASRAFLETTNAITFTDEDMEVQYPDHRRPLYLSAVIKDVQVRRALVDTGSCLNLIPLSTLQAVNLPHQKIQGSPMEVTGFGGSNRVYNGACTACIESGADCGTHTIPCSECGNSLPSSTGEPSIVRPCGTPLPAWEDIKDDPEIDLRELLQRKKKRKEREVEHGSAPQCQEGPTPEEGGLQPSCHLIQQTENFGKVVVDQLQPTAMSSEGSYGRPCTDVFAWDYHEMPGIDPGLVAHSLNVEPGTRPVHPRWLSNIVPVKKKNGQIRCCVDFRNLNKACPKDEFPLPNMDLLIDSAAGHAMFSFMDGFSGYNQIRMSTRDAEKTAFRTPIGNFYYTVMPFAKASAIATMKAPTSHKELKSFLGRLSYIRRFIPGLAAVTAIFMPLMKKGVPFVWSTACQQAFEKIQLIMTKLPTVCAPVPGRPLRLYLASNSEAIGGLVAQEDEDGTEKPIYYVSRALRDAETRYSGAERACLALIYASQRLRHYFLAHKIQLITKSHPIRSLLHRPVLSGRLAQWLLQLSQYEITTETPTAIKSQAIADLLAQFPGEDSSSISHEVPGEIGEALLADLADSTWTLKFDGSSTSSSSGAGIVLTREDGETIAKSFKLDFSCSNNASEYEAYITGLVIAHEMGIKHLRVIGDSNLIICQTKGEFSLKEPSLALYRALAQKLEEKFDTFEISHAMRCENRYADALATLGSQVSFEGSKDWRTPIRAKLMSPEGVADLKMLKDYVLIAGDLYRRLPGGVLARCVNLQEAAKKLTEVHEKTSQAATRLKKLATSLAESQTVMKEAHSGECGEHQGKKRLYQLLLTLGYYWPTMKKDTADFVKSCHTCQLQANLIHTHPTSLQNMATPWPFHTWGLDLIGPINPSSGGYIWILVATEYFSKWVEAVPLRKATGAAVANFIREHIITRFGIPHKIISDNGTPFVNKNAGVLIWQTHYGPTVDQPKQQQGFTPFSLVYGTDAISPTELLVPSPRILHGMDLEADADICAEARVADLEGLEEARELAQVRSLRYHQKLADAYEKTLQTRIFAKGQMVLKTVDHVRRGLPSPSKFAPNWEGPYLIREAYDSGYYKLSTADGTTLVDPINGKWLKRYYS